MNDLCRVLLAFIVVPGLVMLIFAAAILWLLDRME